ncbi:DUF4347 domain-containing protein [Rhodopirellula sp. JC639]|uniref:DUF4347 domain-containing protein n=1 Tax=Stieleria mannarensis TaxID=2755585 RepID=UPI0015FFDE57|nr:DUF4347 domain-containing protein [Rhodopirellula sp. JC639]
MPWRRRKRERKHDSSSILRGGHLIDAAVLEKRLLFSATPIAPPVDHIDAEPETQQPFPDGVNAADATTHAGQGDPSQDDQQRQRRLEVAFVDASIGDYQPLVEALRSESGNADLEIYLLEGSRDGIEQIGEILSAYNHSAYNDVDAVHLLTDGADGQLRLGSSLVNAGNLDGSAGDFAAWGSSLSQDAELILHGFQATQTPESHTMLEAISELTGATVAVPTSDAARAESVAADSSADVTSADEQHTAREIVVVDQTAEDYQQLLADLQSERGDGRSFEVILLDGHSDGIDQISRALAQYDDVDAIHLVTHGTAGRLKLGNAWLSLDNLNDHADTIALWGDSLRVGADVLIYGCDLAANEDGRTLSTSLASLTGADVAASDDDTGHAIFGGDWDLEYSTGAIETSLAFSLDVQQNWAHLLNVTIDNTTTGTAGTGATSTSFAHATAGTDRLMLVGISFGQDMGDSVSSVTYNGVGLTLVGTQEHADPSKSRVEIWSLVAPDLGPHNIVVNFSGTSHQGATVGVMTFTDVDQTTPVGTFTGDQGTSGTPSVTVSSTSNDLVFGVVGVDDNSDWDFTPGSGQTEHWDLFSSQANGSGTTEDGAASVVTSWTYGASTPWAAGAVSIKAAPPANAITVDTTSDTVDGDTSSITALLSNKGTDGFISLREAILAANNTSGTDDIYLGAGTHTLSILGAGENLAATGDLDITESVNIHGDSASTTIIDGSGMGASPDRVFDVLAGTVVNVTDLTITGGQGGGSGGGGVYIATGADLTVTNVVLENNNSNNGGAIQNDGMFTAHTTVIRNNTGNSGSGIDNSGTLVLADVAITGNNAGNAGGGVRNNGTATLTNVTLSGNSATAGAGIHNGGGSAVMTLTNVTISTNTATNSGGGIWTNQNIDATNVTITNNQATTPSTGTGGGVHIAGGGGDVTLKNSILYGNTAAIGPDADAELTSSGYNIASAAAIVEVGSDDTVSDPMLGALTDNGGFTETHALLVGSVAIDPAGLTGAPTTDQRGTTRDATPDIGAFEYVAAGNASPTIYNLAGDTLNYSEGDVATVIEQGGNVTVGDVDSSDFDTGNLTVAITTGGDSGEDVLAIRDQGVGVGNISVSGSDVRYDFGAGPVVIGTVTGGTAGADLVVTFNANATTAAADALVENITYRNTDTDNPTTSARTIRFTLNDGDGGTSAAHDTTVNVAAHNDTPTISNLTGDTLNYSEGDAATVIEQGGNVTVGDVDSADFDTGNLTVAITTGGDSGEDVLAIRDQGAGVGNISVSGSDVRYDFGAGPVVIGTFTGGTAGADLVVTFNANATTAAADALVENITYRNTDTDNPTTSARTIRFTLNDGDGGTSTAHDATVNVAAQNDAPTISNLTGDTLAYLPASGPLVIEFGGDATVSDVDSADFDSGSLTVSVASGNDASEDVLAIRNQGTNPGEISVSGSNVYYNFGAGAVLIGTWSGGSGGADLVVSLNAAADATATTALVRNITYENTDTVAPTTGTRTIRFTVNDGDGAISLNHDATVTVVKGAPGGVANGLKLWLKADAGVTIGLGGVSQWENQVTNATLSDLQQVLSTQRPDLIASGLNFNPIISFDGIDDHLSDLSVWGADLFGADSASLFLAGSTNGSNGVMLQWIDTLSNRVNLEDDLRFDFGDLTNDQLTAPAPSTGYHIINAQATPGAPAGLSIDIDGQQTASGSASVGSPLDNNQFGQFFLGEYPGGGFNDDLDLGEVVIYSTDLSTIDRLKVDSYLAIKYGITLGQVSPATYRDSTGTAIWNAAANSGFEHDVAGIGQDNASLLAQNQSRSINADAIVTMSGASNQNDREFMFWSNDDGALTEVAAEPAGIANRLDRIWRVSETGEIGTTTISFDLSGLTYSGATAADFNLIVDNNTDFNLGATLVSAASYDAGTGIVTFTGVDLADGNYFSLGTSVPTNDAPTINNLSGDTLSYTEGDAAAVIEQGGNVTVTDGDSADFDTGNLTVSVFAGGDNTEDVLAIRDQGPGVGNITVSGSNVLYDFGGGPVVIGTFAGGSGGANLVVTFNAGATATAADALIENITYQNTDTTDPTTSARTIRFTINDGDGGTSVAHDATVNVAAQNDVPAIDNLAGDTLSYTEGDAATVIEQGGNVTLSDGDSANFDTGNLTVSVFAGGDNTEDVLAIRDQGPGVGNITVSGSNVLYDFGGGPVVIGTFTGGSGGANLVVTFNAGATATAADALIENITYQNTDTTNPTTSARTIRFTINDGDGGTSVAHDATVNVAASNAAPAIDLDTNDSSGASGADFAGTFTEGGPAVLIADAADAILTDVDSSNLTQLTVTITNLIDGASETLAANTSGTSITAAYAAGTLTLSGTDTVANYQQVLRTITYHNASSNPDGTTRVIQVVASDGGLPSNVATARIAITTVNDPPTATDDSFSMQAGNTLTIGVGGLLANDVDLDGNSLTVIPVSGPISGTLTLAADGSFQFTPAANFSGPVTFTYAVTDGIATSAPTTVTILVAKPNNLSEVTLGDLASIAADPAPEVETVPEVPAEEENTEEDVETESATEITSVIEADVDVPPVFTRASVIQTTDDELLTLSMVPLSMLDLSDGDQDSERIARVDDGQNGYTNRQSRSQSNRPNVSTLGIVKFDSKLLWGDMEGMQDDIKQSDAAPYYFAGTFAGFSGALSVGYVMWTVRGGLLATSLLAHLPAWSLVDPLLVLNELDDDDDSDDDSLEELLDKTEKEREQSSPTETASQSSASGETLT